MVAEAVTGTRPFAGRAIGELLVAMLRQRVCLPGNDAAWRRLEAVLQRALADDPERRHPSVNAFLQEVVPALDALAEVAESREALMGKSA